MNQCLEQQIKQNSILTLQEFLIFCSEFDLNIIIVNNNNPKQIKANRD
jgi:hypothetical protein